MSAHKKGLLHQNKRENYGGKAYRRRESGRCFFTTGLFLVTLAPSLWKISIPLIAFNLLGSIVWFLVKFTKYSSYKAVKKETGEELLESSKDIIREEAEEIKDLSGEVQSFRSDFDKLRATLAERGVPAEEKDYRD